MSAIRFELEAELRTDRGKGASRRLRRTDRLPAIVYGGGEPPAAISLDHKKTMHALSHEAFYSRILDLKTGTGSEKVILKDVQRHPAKPRLLHIDLLRVRADQKLHMYVPLHFTGQEEAPGIAEGGIFSHLMSEVEVSCLPANLPEFITVDASAMKLNDAIHLTEIKLPEGVELTALAHGAEEHNQAVITIHMPRIEVEEEPVAEAVEEGALGVAGEAGKEGEATTSADGKPASAPEKAEKGEKGEKSGHHGKKEE